MGVPLAPDRPLSEREPRLALRGIAKRFGPVHALRGADFTLRRGEVHALLGENGAGKSTLMHVAYGLVQPDSGALSVDGRPVAIRSPREARRLGIGMVHQHFTSIAALSVAENVALETGWRVHPRDLHERVAALVHRIGLPLDPRADAGSLSVGLLQRLEIVKALATDADVLLLDEPTAVLAPQETNELLRMIRRFADAGGAAVLITHKLHEALAAADRVTVLRHGAIVVAGPAREQQPAALAAAMIGPGAAAAAGVTPPPGTIGAAAASRTPAGTVLLRATTLAALSTRGVPALRGVSFEVSAGEILGIAAVEGNGQRELLRIVAGIETPSSGTLELREPVGFIPEDRTTEGLIPGLSLTENYVLGTLGRLPFTRGLRIQWHEARRRTAALIERADVRTSATAAHAATLSGGNQQKFVVARALELAPQVLVAENPTRGLDLHAAAAVHAELRRAAAEGAAVLVHSSDLDELLDLATRVLVVADGVIRPVPPGASRDEIGRLMLGGTL